MVLGARRRRAQRAATASVNCHHDDASLDEIDREWATADEARRAELLEAMRALAAKYGSRGAAAGAPAYDPGPELAATAASLLSVFGQSTPRPFVDVLRRQIEASSP